MNKNPVCPETGTPMYRSVRPMTLTYKGESITFDMPGWYCDKSEESIHTGEDMKVSDRNLNLLKARHEGLLTPEQIHSIRKKLNLTQESAGQILGGGPRAFQKYESGDLLPSQAICNVLTLLNSSPEKLSELIERRIPNLAISSMRGKNLANLAKLQKKGSHQKKKIGTT